MGNIKFVSWEEFPEDQYSKELVYLLLDDKYRVAYVRKQAKNGGLFWSGMSTSFSKDGVKVFHEAFIQDSAFLEKDIKKFLDDRSWEKKEETVETVKKFEQMPLFPEELPF